MSNKKEKDRIQQCFTLDRGFVRKLEDISGETGVPKSRILEKCFGDSDALADIERFCANVKKRKQEGA